MSLKVLRNVEKSALASQLKCDFQWTDIAARDPFKTLPDGRYRVADAQRQDRQNTLIKIQHAAGSSRLSIVVRMISEGLGHSR